MVRSKKATLSWKVVALSLRWVMVDWLFCVGVLVSHMTTAVATVPTAMMSTSAPACHAAHVVAWSHGSTAVRVLTCEHNTAKTDKGECHDSNDFLLQRS